jgi:hypothetical protein
MGFGQRAGKFNELGRIQSIRPASNPPLTQVDSYTITSVGQPANVIHERDPIFKPGTETALETNATFFEPSESYGADGVPQYSQYVINKVIDPTTPISQYNEYFTVTDPGVMSTSGAYATDTNGGGATLIPRAQSEPSTFRKEGLVQIYITTSSDADAEVAYSDEGVDWCAIAFDNFFFNLVAETASVRSSYRTFRKYLNSAGTTNFAFAQSTGSYSSNANSFGTGSTTYNTNGIYRSKVEPFFKRQSDGQQCYLKTNVTFAGASVSASRNDGGSVTATLNSNPVTNPLGFKSYTEGVDDPIYTATPGSGFLVSLKVDGVAQSISDPTAALSHTFTDISGGHSFEAIFGHKVTTTSGGANPVGITSTNPQYVATGGSVTVTFDAEPDTVTFNSVSQDVATGQTSFTVSNIIEDVTVAATKA